MIVEEPWNIVSNVYLDSGDMSEILERMKHSSDTAQDAACWWIEQHKEDVARWLEDAQKYGGAGAQMPKWNGLIAEIVLLGLALCWIISPVSGVAWANRSPIHFALAISKRHAQMAVESSRKRAQQIVLASQKQAEQLVMKTQKLSATQMLLGDKNITDSNVELADTTSDKAAATSKEVMTTQHTVDQHETVDKHAFGGEGIRFLSSKVYAMETHDPFVEVSIRSAQRPTDSSDEGHMGWPFADAVFCVVSACAVLHCSRTQVYLMRTGDASAVATATVSTADGTALAGVNYRSVESMNVVFEPGERTAVVRVELPDNTQWSPLLSFTVYVEDVSSGAVRTRPYECSVFIFNDDRFPVNEKPSDTNVQRLLAYVAWQFEVGWHMGSFWVASTVFSSIMSKIVFLNLDIKWMDQAIEKANLEQAFHVAALRIFLTALLQITSYWYNSGWGQRDRTYADLARKLFCMPYEVIFDVELLSDLTKLSEDAAILCSSTFGVVLSIAKSCFDLFLTFLFLLTSAGWQWEGAYIQVYVLMSLILLLSLVFLTSGNYDPLIKSLIRAQHDTTQQWNMLLRQRVVSISNNIEENAVKKLESTIHAERDLEWQCLVFMDSTIWKAKWAINVVIFVLYFMAPVLINQLQFPFSRVLAVIFAIQGLQSSLLTTMTQLKALSSGIAQLDEFSKVFNISTNAEAKIKSERKKIQFLVDRLNEGGDINLLVWKDVSYRSVLTPEETSTIRDDAAKLASANKVVPNLGNPSPRVFLSDTDLRTPEANGTLVLGGVITVVFDLEVPLKMKLALMRLLGGLVPPSEGLLFLPPYAETISNPHLATIFPGTILQNIRFSCDKLAVPPALTNSQALAICVATGLHYQLIEMATVDKIELRGVGFEVSLGAADHGILVATTNPKQAHCSLLLANSHPEFFL